MSDEDQRSSSATTDLQSITPDSWQNIPAPLKQAVSLLAKHLIALSHAHTSLHSSLTFTSDTLTTRLKQATRSMNAQGESATIASKRNGEEIETMKDRLDRELQTLKESVTGQMALQNQRIAGEILNLREAHEDLSAKVIGLQNVVSSSTSDLKSSISNIKSSTRYEIEEFLLKPELQSIHENVTDLSLAYKKAEKQLIIRMDALEDYQRTTIQSKLDKVDKAVEATISNLSETKEVSMSYSGLIAKSVEAAMRPIIAETNRIKHALDKQTAEMPIAMSELKQYLEEFALTASSKHEGVFAKVEEIVANAGKTIRNETAKVSKDLTAMMEEKERDLLSEQYAAISSLETRLIQLQETYVESQIREIRQKLTVLTTQWLPINLTDLKGMTPTEARLYMVEARLRSEENKRIQSIDKVYEKMGEMKGSQSRARKVRTAEWQRASLSETLQTPTTIGTIDRDIRTVFTPGGMPARQPRHRRRTQNLQSGLSVQSSASKIYTVPLISPFDQISVNISQKDMMTIYKDFSPAVYSGRGGGGVGKEGRGGDGEKRGSTPKPSNKRISHTDHRVSISSVISPEAARSLPSSREQSPVRYVTLHQNEAVQFEGITEEV